MLDGKCLAINARLRMLEATLKARSMTNALIERLKARLKDTYNSLSCILSLAPQPHFEP